MEEATLSKPEPRNSFMRALAKPKVLIVDDDPVSLTLLGGFLQPAGYRIVSAKDGAEAWELLTNSSHNFAAVVADRVMPEMDGIELTYKMREQPAFRRTPIIMLTAYPGRDEQISAIQGGVYDYLMKPIDQDLLLLVLKRALASV